MVNICNSKALNFGLKPLIQIPYDLKVDKYLNLKTDQTTTMTLNRIEN